MKRRIIEYLVLLALFEAIALTFGAWQVGHERDKIPAGPFSGRQVPGYTPALPKSVKVGTVRYSLSYGCAPDDWGTTWPEDKKICLSGDMAPEKFREVLWHELLHAVAKESGAKDIAFDEEQFILLTAPFMVNVLRDNPEIERLLTEKK